MSKAVLSRRAELVLKHVVGQYIARAVPIASQSLLRSVDLGVCSATIRHEMAHLEQEGYIIRPHTSAGCIPSDKGYRYYVQTLGEVALPLEEQRMISHLFHQVEEDIEEWLNLAATLLARLTQNVALVTMPKPADCKFKHLELISLRESVALAVLVLHGARVRQWLIKFDRPVSQETLTAIASKLSAAYAGLSSARIAAKKTSSDEIEQQVTNHLIRVMQTEDEPVQEPPRLEGWYFMLNQPEFNEARKVLNLMELVEQRSLLKHILPKKLPFRKVQVVIGTENREEAFHDYSVVMSRYGIPHEAEGAVGVIGPKRMPYAQTIAVVRYLSSVLSELLVRLYGREETERQRSKPGEN